MTKLKVRGLKWKRLKVRGLVLDFFQKKKKWNNIRKRKKEQSKYHNQSPDSRCCHISAITLTSLILSPSLFASCRSSFFQFRSPFCFCTFFILLSYYFTFTAILLLFSLQIYWLFHGTLRGHLVWHFKQHFLVFKQHYTYFHILFHLHIFLKNTNNVTRTTLPNRPSILPFCCYYYYISFIVIIVINLLKE